MDGRGWRVDGCGEKAIFTADRKQTVERIDDPAELLKHFKQGDWNTYRVVRRGPDITLYVNSVLMYQITDHRATQAVTRGIIALQMHPGLQLLQPKHALSPNLGENLIP